MSDKAIEALQRLVGTSRATRQEVADVLGVNEQTLYQITAGIKLRSGKPRGVGRELREKLDQHYPSWMDADIHKGEGVDHFASLRPMHAVSLTREQLMSGNAIPEQFTFVLFDDAMRPHGRAGEEVFFRAVRSDEPVKVGAGVLVKDSQGELHVRRKVQGRSAAHWTAAAPNDAYRDLDSIEDGLTVLAVWQAIKRGLEDA